MVASWANDICRLCLNTGAIHHLWPDRVQILTTYTTLTISVSNICNVHFFLFITLTQPSKFSDRKHSRFAR